MEARKSPRKSPRKSVMSSGAKEGVDELDGVEFEVTTVTKAKSKRAKKEVFSFDDDDEEDAATPLLPKRKRRLSGNSATDGEEEKTPTSRKKGKVSVQENETKTDYLDVDGLSAGGRTDFETQAARLDDEVEVIKDEEAGDGGLAVSQDDDMLLTQLSAFQTQETVEGDVVEVQERRVKPRAASSLPIVFAEKINRTKVLMECDGDALDLSGDMGAVGRFTVDPHDAELCLDLKGVIYKTTIVPSNTFFVVETIMSDFVQLRADTNRTENETMVEGTLEDFGFDTDDEGERPAADGGGDKAATAEKVEHEEGADDGKQAKKKKPPAKGASKNGKVPAKKAVAGKTKAGRGKASAKGGKKPTAKKAKPKASTGKK